jgi:hypothetical protein
MDHEIFVPHDDQERRNVRALEEYLNSIFYG